MHGTLRPTLVQPRLCYGLQDERVTALHEVWKRSCVVRCFPGTPPGQGCAAQSMNKMAGHVLVRYQMSRWHHFHFCAFVRPCALLLQWFGMTTCLSTMETMATPVSENAAPCFATMQSCQGLAATTPLSGDHSSIVLFLRIANCWQRFMVVCLLNISFFSPEPT